MASDNWCPENDFAWQKEQAEIRALGPIEENKRLRAALKKIADGREIRNGDPRMNGTFDQHPHLLSHKRMMEIAAEALAAH